MRLVSESVRQRGVNRCRQGVVAEAPSSRQMGTNRVSWQVAFSAADWALLLRQTARATGACMLAVRTTAGGDMFAGYYPLRTMRRICQEITLVQFRKSVYCSTVVITSALACCSSLETTNLLRPTGQTPTPPSEVLLALQVYEPGI